MKKEIYTYDISTYANGELSIVSHTGKKHLIDGIPAYAKKDLKFIKSVAVSLGVMTTDDEILLKKSKKQLRDDLRSAVKAIDAADEMRGELAETLARATHAAYFGDVRPPTIQKILGKKIDRFNIDPWSWHE